jgi:hypothetical protein
MPWCSFGVYCSRPNIRTPNKILGILNSEKRRFLHLSCNNNKQKANNVKLSATMHTRLLALISSSCFLVVDSFVLLPQRHAVSSLTSNSWSGHRDLSTPLVRLFGSSRGAPNDYYAVLNIKDTASINEIKRGA